LNRQLRLYVAGILACGIGPMVWSARAILFGQVHAGWFILAGLAVVGGLLSIRIPSAQTTLSLSEAFIFAAILLFGPEAGIATAALDGLVVSLSSRHRRWDRLLFNVAEPALSVCVTAWMFYSLTGTAPLLGRDVDVEPMLPALLAMTTAYFTINTVLAGVAHWMEVRASLVDFLRSHLQHLSLDYFVGVAFAVIVVQNAAHSGLGAVFVILPLLLSSHLSSRNLMARLESVRQHLSDLRRLYDSTVETLAMAVDAKDQVTHGHIRRVQQRCRKLATVMGTSDEQALRALDAAALLHDLGKLAVPEHILNKPGPLTPAEFDQMKLHAAAGADMLSAIEFPFPVVPLVRHHHENWDGTGYPDGLAGDAIPLGARILAVVDCYDALTSDRPYRRKLADPAALDIIRSRSGRMYDPEVVDAFLRLHADEMLAHEESHPARARRLLDRPSDDEDAPARTPVDGVGTAGSDNEIARLVLGLEGRTPSEVAASVTDYVRKAMPGCFGVLYRYEPATDELISDHVPTGSGRWPARVRLGGGITGWVGANRRTMANSDASLDLGEDARTHRPPLQVCLSAPIVQQGALVGVLTIYSSGALFNEVQRMHVDRLAHALAGPLSSAPLPVLFA
jgi:HD-GYP domain-containing protein (c-di-GMP phosphodiesterase class II)/uncharacterized membrane protein